MEPFASCIVGGLVFCILAIFWILQSSFNTARQFYDSRGIEWKPPKPVKYFNRFPVEGVFLIVFTLCAFCTEQVYPKWKWRMFNDNSEIVNQSEWLHCTIYTSFLFYGICKALATKSIQGVWYYVPLFRCFAFFVETLLLIFHLIDSDLNRSYLNNRMHLLHILSLLPVLIGGILEGWWDDPLLVRLRSFATFLQGTWLIQMAFTLYKAEPPTEPDHNGLSITDFQIGAYQYNSVADSNNLPSAFSKNENNLRLSNFYVMVFVWHCMMSVIVISFFHAMMRALAVCIYRRVLQQKVAKGEDVSMLNPTQNEV